MGRQAAPLAKITRPVPTGVIQREPLFRRLDRARDHPVIWISGPAGSGKTTLASSYLEARALPCLWYQVDSGDADLATPGSAASAKWPGGEDLPNARRMPRTEP